MSGAVLEARAVIKGEDRTKAAFDSIEARIKRLMAATTASGEPFGGFDARLQATARGMEQFDRIARDVSMRFEQISMRAAEAAKATSAFDRVNRDMARRPPALFSGDGRSGHRSASHRPGSRFEEYGHHATAGIAGLIAAEKAQEFVVSALHNYKEFDDLILYQKAVGDLTPGETQSRVKQAVTLGGSTKFNDLQVLEAQLTLQQRGVKKELIEPMVGEIVHFAQAMNVQLPEAAKTLEGVIFSTGQNVEDASTAATVMRRNIDQAVKAAKLGGLSSEDIAQAMKFGGATAHGAGFSNPTLLAMIATLHRAGYGGDEAGVAARAIASHLVAPTSKGLNALDSMGIHFNDYTTMPGGMSAENLGRSVSRRLGKQLPADDLAKVQGYFNDDELMADREKLIPAVVGAIAHNFTTAKGKPDAAAAKQLAKVVGDFYAAGISAVDVQRLLSDILARHPTIAQANMIATDKHGGKLQAMSEKAETFDQMRDGITHVPEGFAKTIGDERMAGFAGAVDKLQGSFLNLETAVGRADDAFLTITTSRIAEVVQHIAELDSGTIKAGTELIALGTALGAMKMGGLLSDGFGLKGAAVDLKEAAAAIRSASGRGGTPGASGAPGGEVPPPGSEGPKKNEPRKPGAFDLFWQMAIYDTVKEGALRPLLDALPHPAFPKGYDPKAIEDRGLMGHLQAFVGDMRQMLGPYVHVTPASAADPWLSGERQAIEHRAAMSADEFRRNPEAARGRAMMNMQQPASVQLDPGSKATVEASFKVEPSSELIRIVEQAKTIVASGSLQAGAVGTSGSTGHAYPQTAPTGRAFGRGGH